MNEILERLGGTEAALAILVKQLQDWLERMERIEAALAILVNGCQIQDWYDTKAAAKLIGKSPYTVREWCRQGRVHATKRACGRGNSEEWMISHNELMRIRAEGLLPDPMSYRHPRPT
ncbi:MAG: helix-turn-helix domain-containing protein [Planctomycetota bacterium]|nr:helix-turn-helix domain-containing protein [Planctomycetota bacterium]